MIGKLTTSLRQAVVAPVPIPMRKLLRRAPLLAQAKLHRWGGRPWTALDAAIRALSFARPSDPVAVKVLWQALREAPCAPHWADFFDRDETREALDLRHDSATSGLFEYLNGFCSAITACETVCSPLHAHMARIFGHHWWKVYRHTDGRMGRFLAYGNSDQSQEIGALRHVIEFACYRNLARTAGDVEPDGPEWRQECCRLVLALQRHMSASDLPVMLLSAEYLASIDRLDEARDFAERCRNINSRCLITQLVLDCIEAALDRRARNLPYAFSLLEDAPRQFAGRFCPVPFENAYINPDGDTFLCCSTILPVSIGNVFHEKSWSDVWNSPTAQEVRGAILDGTYKYCNKRSCPDLLNDTLISTEQALNHAQTSRQQRWREALTGHNVTVSGPAFADLGYDISCNLSCPQCRLDLIVADRSSTAKIDALREGMIDALLAELETVCITSGGEALFSRHFRRLLADINPTRCPTLKRLLLLSNGMLFDRRQWETFRNLHYLEIMLTISIDASSKETFESIRRNGRWDRMLANLEFAGSLRREGKLVHLKLSYAVQAENFREMVDAVRLAERLQVDQIDFFKLENIGTYSEAEYRQRNIAEPSHPQHQELLAILQDSIFGSPLVHRHNIGPLIVAAQNEHEEVSNQQQAEAE